MLKFTRSKFFGAPSNAAAALLGLALSATCHAAWEATPEVAIGASHDDNLRLVPDDLPSGVAVPAEANATVLEARLRATSTGERSYLFFEPRVHIDHYLEDENETLNGADTFLRARARYDWTQASLAFFLDYDDQDILDAEVTEAFPDDPDIEDPTDPDTGLIIVDEDRERFIFGPSLDVRVSDRSSLVFATQVLDVSYSGRELQSRSDFLYTAASAGILRRVDGRNEVSARLAASEYEADFNNNQTKTFGVEGTFDRELSRNWTFNMLAGVSRSDYSFLGGQGLVENADTNFTFAVGLRQRSVRNTINIDLSHEAMPNSGGYLTLRDELHVYLVRAFSERLQGQAGVRGYVTKTLDGVVNDDDRDYLRVDLALEWAMTDRLFINGGYAFTSQQFSGADASSNNIFVGIAYRGRSSQ
jgi:hypothetical protein